MIAKNRFGDKQTNRQTDTWNVGSESEENGEEKNNLKHFVATVCSFDGRAETKTMMSTMTKEFGSERLLPSYSTIDDRLLIKMWLQASINSQTNNYSATALWPLAFKCIANVLFYHSLYVTLSQLYFPPSISLTRSPLHSHLEAPSQCRVVIWLILLLCILWVNVHRLMFLQKNDFWWQLFDQDMVMLLWNVYLKIQKERRAVLHKSRMCVNWAFVELVNKFHNLNVYALQNVLQLCV